MSECYLAVKWWLVDRREDLRRMEWRTGVVWEDDDELRTEAECENEGAED